MMFASAVYINKYTKFKTKIKWGSDQAIYVRMIKEMEADRVCSKLGRLNERRTV